MPLATPTMTTRPFYRSRVVQAAAAGVLFVALAVFVARLEIGRDLSRLHVGVLSGAREGNYHAVVDRMAAAAGVRHGIVTNVESAGSVENLAKLARASGGACDVAFALIQDGALIQGPSSSSSSSSLELLGRLPRAESVLFLGAHADDIADFASLRGMRIGIGPEGSGAAKIAREILQSRDFDTLGLTLSTHPLVEQLDLAAKGELDLAVVVMDEDAPLVDAAVRERGLQIAGFAHADVLLSRVAHVHVGRIGAGHYDPVRVLPAADKTVLQVDTLLVGNGCAGRSKTVALLGVVTDVFPDFVRANVSAPNASGLPLSSAAKSYFENDGPEVFDEYAPWLVDIMPAGKWVYIVTALSLLFNAMGFGHRFQLWRIDAARVQLEGELTGAFGPATTLGDIERMPGHASAETLATCERIVHDLEALAQRSRKQSLSILVPMGQEMAYRFQEDIVHQTLATLRAFLKRARPSA